MAGKPPATMEKSAGRSRDLLPGISGLVKFFPEDNDQRLAHPLQVLVALLQEPRGRIGRIIISPVPIAEQWLQGQLMIGLPLGNHAAPTCYFIVRKMGEH